ncbi:MAG: transcriptional regulator [Bacteroidia bacterium]|nr:transcriptional regulator [Bacteroidia bacterium]
MKETLNKLNKAFENRVRLGIMSILLVEEWVAYSFLKKTLEQSDGNLATHLKNLRKLNYIQEKKEFKDRKPHTTYQVTEEGKKAFEDHLNAIEEIMRSMGQTNKDSKG